MCDKLMGIVNSLMGERDQLSTRLAQLEAQLRDTEAALERIMSEQREKQMGKQDEQSFFLTGAAGEEEKAAIEMGKTENERILEERIQASFPFHMCTLRFSHSPSCPYVFTLGKAWHRESMEQGTVFHSAWAGARGSTAHLRGSVPHTYQNIPGCGAHARRKGVLN